MALLRRVLYLHALVAAVAGAALVVAPRPLLSVLGQPPYPDYAWVRLAGVGAITLALLAVLVGHRAQELWWWSWAFVLGSAGTAAVLTLHAAFGLPPGAAAWGWWVSAVGAWALAAGLLWGLARAGGERPVV